MRRQSDGRGEVKSGGCSAIIVVAAAIFAGSKFVPVYVASYDLKDVLRREVQGAALKSDKAIIATFESDNSTDARAMCVKAKGTRVIDDRGSAD